MVRRGRVWPFVEWLVHWRFVLVNSLVAMATTGMQRSTFVHFIIILLFILGNLREDDTFLRRNQNRSPHRQKRQLVTRYPKLDIPVC